MKAYNEILLRNEYAQKMAKRWHQEGLLSDAQWNEAQQIHTELPYKPNIFIGIGLFLFTNICFSFGATFIGMMLGFGSGGGLSVLSLLYGAGVLFLLLRLITIRKFHFSWVDNALIYGIIGTTIFPMVELYEALKIAEPWIGVLLFLPILLAVTYSFGEPLVALGALMSILFIVASLLMKHPVSKALLPFALMGVSGGVYALLQWFSQKKQSFYWQTAIYWVNIASLVIFYLAGNYGFVREANAQLNDLPTPSPEIAFAPLFWALTFLIPVGFLYRGFRKRDQTLLVFGLLALVASICTIRVYHSVLPPEWALLLGGVVTTAVVYWLIRSLQSPRYGFSYAPERLSEERAFLQAAIFSRTSHHIQTADHGVKFGGGDLGGGGAGEKY